MGGTRVPALLALLGLAAAAVGAGGEKPDPWPVPAPDIQEMLLTIGQSPRSYEIRIEEKVPEAALPPERVEPPATEEDRKALGACRGLATAEKWPEAEAALKDLLAKSPTLHDARALLGTALLRQKRPAEAAVALRDALIGNRRDPAAWKALEETAAALGKKVLRPAMQPGGWLLPGNKKGSMEVGVVARDDSDAAYCWIYYGMGRAMYRFEGRYSSDFGVQPYVRTFREELYALGAVVRAAEDDRKEGKKLTPDLARLLAEKKAGTLVPFAFFACYADPLAAAPERDFDALRPRLEKWFDEKVLVRK
jgi:tetratricopeptide (TPR) repeat protein